MFALSPRSTIAIRGPVSPGSSTSVMAVGETWPTKSWSSQRWTAARGRAGRLLVHVAGRGHDAAQAAVRAEVAGQGARVDAGDGRDRVVAQQRCQLAGVIEDGGGRVRHDERPEPRADRLVVDGEPAVVADQRVGHDHDLAGVRGVGADLLVAGLARVDDEVAAGRRLGRRTRHRGRSNRPRAPAARDPGRRCAGRRRRWHGVGAGRSPTAHQGPGYDEPTGHRARWAWTNTVDGPPSPASRDRYASLTGPAMKGRGQRSIPVVPPEPPIAARRPRAVPGRLGLLAPAGTRGLKPFPLHPPQGYVRPVGCLATPYGAILHASARAPRHRRTHRRPDPVGCRRDVGRRPRRCRRHTGRDDHRSHEPGSR